MLIGLVYCHSSINERVHSLCHWTTPARVSRPNNEFPELGRRDTAGFGISILLSKTEYSVLMSGMSTEDACRQRCHNFSPGCGSDAPSILKLCRQTQDDDERLSHVSCTCKQIWLPSHRSPLDQFIERFNQCLHHENPKSARQRSPPLSPKGSVNLSVATETLHHPFLCHLRTR